MTDPDEPTDDDIRDACKAMYDEMRRWHDEGYQLLVLERDGENLKIRPVA